MDYSSLMISGVVYRDRHVFMQNQQPPAENSKYRICASDHAKKV